MRSKYNGFSLVELLIVSLLLSVVILGAFFIFTSAYAALASWEVYNRMKIEGQYILNEVIGASLSRNKRIFSCKREGEPCTCAGCRFLQRISLPAEFPKVGFSKLPQVKVSGVLSPSQENFDPGIFGNTLFFGANTEVASLSVSFAQQNEVVSIDLFQFFLYYLSFYPNLPIAQKTSCINLVEYKSKLYADYQRLLEIQEYSPHKLTETIRKLREAYPDLTHAWDYTAATPQEAFYSLENNNLAPHPQHQIQMYSCKPLLNTVHGVLGSKLKLSVCYNTDSTQKLKRLYHKVPVFAAKSGEFPAGFEIGVIGTSGAREVHFHFVLLSETIGGVHSHRTEVTHTVRDVW